MNDSTLICPTPLQDAEKNKKPLVGKTLEELRALIKLMGEPAFRADQLHHWMYVKNARTFEGMTNLAQSFRDKLAQQFVVGCFDLAEKQVSADGTRKYLFRLSDGQLIESVLMYFKDRDGYSVCISSQVGCAVDCSFCATGKLGFKRNLTVPEIVDQYLYVQADLGQDVRNVVFMGQGEPLLNYDNLLSAIKILNQSAEVGMRHITISTSGIVPKINQLAEEKTQLVLALSLHAPDNETRSPFMPINEKWPVEVLMQSLHDYIRQCGRRVTIEYILLAGINDSKEHAHKLGLLTRSLKCNINLIPYNPIGEDYDFKRPSMMAIDVFKTELSRYGKKVTLRMERGTDIDAACGQLANQATLIASQ